MNGVEQKRGVKYWFIRLLVIIAIISIPILMNKDVSDRAYNYASVRQEAKIVNPTMMDMLCFRRFVWVSDQAFRINMFGVERVYGRSAPSKK